MTITKNCRVTRHLTTTSNPKHGRPAETKPDRTIFTHDLYSWSNDSMDKVIDPSKCPICGEPNQCAQEIAKVTGKAPERCWCMTATFSSELLDLDPLAFDATVKKLTS